MNIFTRGSVPLMFSKCSFQLTREKK